MSPHGEQICVDGVSIPCGYRPDDDPTKANSRLVCAAPDMAEAIQIFLAEHDNCGSPAFEGLRAALAKAGL